MNIRELAENLEMAEEEFLEMLDLFWETSSFDLRELQSAMEEGDAQKAIHAAHSIKGAAVNLGLMEIYEVAKETEMEARENYLERTGEMARTIKEKLDRIAEALGRRNQ